MEVRIAILMAALMLLPPANALFLVGGGKVGESISILCENQESVFVSQPDGTAQQVSLDSSFQAEFTPQQSGPHTVQCGKEAKTIEVAPGRQAGAGTERMSQTDATLAFAAAGILLALMLATLFSLAKSLLSQAQFTKTVEGGRAKILLKAGKGLQRIEMEDPVAFSYAGKPLRFSIPELAAGKEWSWEYGISSPEKALPASLEALEGGKKVSILSRLLIEGKENGAGKAYGGAMAGGTRTTSPKMRRTLPKAE